MGFYKKHVIIVAECGGTTNGDINLARRLIYEAKKAKVDYVKFQKRNPELYSNEMYMSPFLGMVPYKEHRRFLEFSEEEYNEIDDLCKTIEMPWFASVFDVDSLNFILKYDVPYLKIPSPKILDIEFVKEVARANKPTIMSTGMCTEKELNEAVNSFITINGDLTILHCTSCYPAQNHQINLQVMRTLHKKFGLPTGYSSHDKGLAISLAAVGMGAKMIEKHLTLDRTLRGTDHAASIEPLGMQRLVKYIRAIEQAFGSSSKRLLKCEYKAREKATGVKVDETINLQ